MAFDLQFQALRLCSAMADNLQNRLNSTCLPPLGDQFVDHYNVDEAAQLGAISADGSTLPLLIGVEVFIVSMAELYASVNDTPNGANESAGRVIVTLNLSVSGTQMIGSIGTLDLSELHKLSNTERTLLEIALNNLLSGMGGVLFDAAELIGPLQLNTVAASKVEIIGPVVAVRYDPTTPIVNGLVDGEQWGLVIQSQKAVALGKSYLPDTSLLPVWTNLEWKPIGKTPRVRLKADVYTPIPLPLHGEFIATVEFAYVKNHDACLRATFGWSLDLDSSPIAELFIEALAEPYVMDLIRTELAEGIKSEVQISDNAFYIDTPVNIPEFMGIQLLMNSVQANAAGMTIGGPIIFRRGVRTPMSYSYGQFGAPYINGVCVEKKKEVTINDVLFFANIEFNSHSAYCGLQYLGPPAPNLVEPAHGSLVVPAEVSWTLPASLAQLITKDVLVLLRTTRGTRLINLAHPKIVVGEDGQVLNVIDVRISQCIEFQEPKGTISMGGAHKVDTSKYKPRPLEEPDWMQLMGARYGLNVHLVTMAGLQPGELVEFKSDAHRIVVSANTTGQATLPAFVPHTELSTVIEIKRISGVALATRPTVMSAVFKQICTLQAGDDSSFMVSPGGSVTVTRRIGRRLVRNQFGIGGLAALAREFEHDLTELNPQPLPPEPPPHAALVALAGIPDVVATHSVPGFQDHPLAIAVLADGTKLLVERDGRAHARVAGIFEGPIVDLTNEGTWAMGRLGARLSMFSYSAPDTLSCRSLNDPE